MAKQSVRYDGNRDGKLIITAGDCASQSALSVVSAPASLMLFPALLRQINHSVFNLLRMLRMLGQVYLSNPARTRAPPLDMPYPHQHAPSPATFYLGKF